MAGTTTISIPKQLAEKIKKSIEGTGFGSVSDYATYILRQIEAGREKEQKEPFTKKDEEKAKDRLRKLGYL